MRAGGRYDRRVFILPLGHENTTVRRLPWVTIGLMVLCTLALLWSKLGGDEAQREEARLAHEIFAVQTKALAAYELERANRLSLEGRIEQMMQDSEELTENGGLQRRQLQRIAAFRRGELLPPDHELYLRYLSLTDRLERNRQRMPVAMMGYRSAQDGVVSMLTSLFAHSGWLHLIGNLWFLYLTGCYLEDRWGRGVFLAFYLLGGIAGCVTYAALHPDSETNLIGASGAISATMGAFVVCFARVQVRFFALYFFMWRFQVSRFWVPAWVVLPLWLLDQLLMVSMESVTGVAHSAHVGGFVFGLGVALIYRFTDIDRSLDAHLDREATGDAGWSEREAFLAALSARDAGDLPAAIAHLQETLQVDGDRPEVHREMLEVCVEAKDARAVGPSASFLLRRCYDRADHAELASLYRLLRRELPGWQADARELAWVVEAAARERDAVSVVHAAGTLLNRHPGHPYVPRALWLAAEAQQQHGRTRLVRDTLGKLIARFPDDNLATQARQRLTQLGPAGAGA